MKGFQGGSTVLLLLTEASLRDRSLFIIRVGTDDKTVGCRKFLGRQSLGSKNLDKAKGCAKM